MVDTPKPSDSSPQRPRLTSYFAISLLVVGIAFLLIIPSGLIGAALVLGGFLFFAVIGLHYLVWGRWLDRLIREEQLEEREGP